MGEVVKGYRVNPGEQPKPFKTATTLSAIDAAVGGAPTFLKVRLRSGKGVSIIFNSDPINLKDPREYNFTLQVFPEKKRSWIDFMGTVLILGRDDEDLVDLDLDEDEISELVSHPYD